MADLLPSGLQCRSATKHYGDRAALRETSLRCPRGQVTALIGPNGAGKSTLFRAATGLVPLDSGRIEVGEHPAGSRAALARVSLMPEQPDLYPGVSVWEHVTFVALLYGLEAWEPDARRILRRFDLHERTDALSHELSQGMRRRLALVMALLRGADVLLLDEPFNGLDPGNSAELRAMVRELAEGGATVLVATHILSDVARIADRAVVLAGGQVLAEGALDELYAVAGLGPDADLEQVYLAIVGVQEGSDDQQGHVAENPTGRSA